MLELEVVRPVSASTHEGKKKIEILRGLLNLDDRHLALVRRKGEHAVEDFTRGGELFSLHGEADAVRTSKDDVSVGIVEIGMSAVRFKRGRRKLKGK